MSTNRNGVDLLKINRHYMRGHFASGERRRQQLHILGTVDKNNRKHLTHHLGNSTATLLECPSLSQQSSQCQTHPLFLFPPPVSSLQAPSG